MAYDKEISTERREVTHNNGGLSGQYLKFYDISDQESIYYDARGICMNSRKRMALGKVIERQEQHISEKALVHSLGAKIALLCVIITAVGQLILDIKLLG
jgi:hypothetical protein